jgi:hypothetical protein
VNDTKVRPPVDAPIEEASRRWSRWAAEHYGSPRTVDPLGPEFFGPWYDRDRWADEVEFFDAVSEWVLAYQATRWHREILDGLTLSIFIDWEVDRWAGEDPDSPTFRDRVEPFWFPDSEFPTLDGFVEAMWDLGLGYEPPRPESTRIVINANARPPEVKFQVLAGIEPRFVASYERNRPDLHNDQSAIDFSLATWSIRVGWSDQAVCDLLISSRRNCKRADDRAKGTRRDYLERTIKSARATVQKREHTR